MEIEIVCAQSGASTIPYTINVAQLIVFSWRAGFLLPGFSTLSAMGWLLALSIFGGEHGPHSAQCAAAMPQMWLIFFLCLGFSYSVRKTSNVETLRTNQRTA